MAPSFEDFDYAVRELDVATILFSQAEGEFAKSILSRPGSRTMNLPEKEQHDTVQTARAAMKSAKAYLERCRDTFLMINRWFPGRLHEVTILA